MMENIVNKTTIEFMARQDPMKNLRLVELHIRLQPIFLQAFIFLRAFNSCCLLRRIPVIFATVQDVGNFAYQRGETRQGAFACLFIVMAIIVKEQEVCIPHPPGHDPVLLLRFFGCLTQPSDVF